MASLTLVDKATMKYLLVLSTLLVAAFGSKLDSKIVGGSDANIEEFPYVVSVRLYDQHFCTGIILDENTILTAAQCTQGRDHTRMSIRAGSNQIDGGESHDVYYVVQHPEFNQETMDNDLSVLTLSTPLSYSDKIFPVTLVPQGWEIRPNTIAEIAGWGAEDESATSFVNTLQSTYTYIISHEDCVAYYQDLKEILPSMICGIVTGKDACAGDAGGPLVVNGYLIGTISWGSGCARPDRPGVYAKIGANYEWIASNM